jgi:hypothetical protein
MNKYVWREVKLFAYIIPLSMAGIYLFMRYRHFDLSLKDWYIVIGLVGLIFISTAILLLTKNSRSSKSRDYGMQVELAAVAALRAAIPSNYKLCHSYKLKRGAGAGGDIDILLTKTALMGLFTRRKYAIEIKAWGGVFARNGTLFKVSDGSVVFGNPAMQCHKNAVAVGAIAVLWLPTAKKMNRLLFTEYLVGKEIVVVNGDAEYLMKTLTVANRYQF